MGGGTQKKDTPKRVFLLGTGERFRGQSSQSAPKTKSQPSPRHGPSGPRRECGVNSERSEELRRGGFAVPEHFNPKGGGALWAAEPKKKDTPKRVFLFETGGQFRGHLLDQYLKSTHNPT